MVRWWALGTQWSESPNLRGRICMKGYFLVHEASGLVFVSLKLADKASDLIKCFFLRCLEGLSVR